MRLKVIFFVLFSTIFVLSSCQDSVPPTESDSEQAEISSLEKYFDGNRWENDHDVLMKKFVSAVNAKDLESFMDCWWNSPDVILVLEIGWVVRGYDNIKAGVQGLMDTNKTLHLEINYISRFRLGKNIYSVGIATWTRDDGKFQEVWTDVATLVDSELVYVMDHAHDLRPFPSQPNFP